MIRMFIKVLRRDMRILLHHRLLVQMDVVHFNGNERRSQFDTNFERMGIGRWGEFWEVERLNCNISWDGKVDGELLWAKWF
jgi:hypothetical protein